MCLAAAAVEMISEETAAGRDTAGAGVGGCVGFFSKRGIRHQKRFALVRYLPVVFDRGLVRWRCRVKILFQGAGTRRPTALQQRNSQVL